MGRGQPLSAVDAAWLHMDRPENSADVVALIEFARPLAPGPLKKLIEERLLRHARFRERVISTGVLGGARWEPDTAFSLERHLVRHRLAGRASLALRQLVGEVATEPLDPHKAPWRLHLVEGVGRGSAMIAKLHHCMGDGFALVGLLLSLADEDLHAPQPEPARTPLWRLPDRTATQGVRFAESLARMTGLPPDPATHLQAELTGRRRIAWSSGVPLEELRQGAHRRGATVNDVLMAAVAGALRRELKEEAAPDVRALVPVNLRRGEAVDEDLGNRFGLVFLDLPTSRPTPEARLRTVQRSMSALKGSLDAVAAYSLLGAMGLAPPTVERRLADFFTRKASLVVTNVPGPRTPLHFGGVRIDRLLFWVPHPGLLGLGISLLSYAGDVTVGVRADEAVLEDPATLVHAIVRELTPFRVRVKRAVPAPQL